MSAARAERGVSRGRPVAAGRKPWPASAVPAALRGVCVCARARAGAHARVCVSELVSKWISERASVCVWVCVFWAARALH